MNLIDILSNLPVKNFKDVGPIISFADIYQACAQYGHNNSLFIEHKIGELERDNVLYAVYDEQELLIGVKLKAWKF